MCLVAAVTKDAVQVVGLLLDWLSMRCRGNSLEEAGHRAWMDRLSALLQRHTTALEANLILTALNGRAAEALDVVPSLWLDLYRAFTHVLLHAQVFVPRDRRFRIKDEEKFTLFSTLPSCFLPTTCLSIICTLQHNSQSSHRVAGIPSFCGHLFILMLQLQSLPAI